MSTFVLALVLCADLRPGSPIAVEMKIGTVTVEVQGRVIPCSKGKTCAQLQTGKRVQGRIANERFIVEDLP